MYGWVLCEYGDFTELQSNALLLLAFLELPSIRSSFPLDPKSVCESIALSDCLQLRLNFIPSHHHRHLLLRKLLQLGFLSATHYHDRNSSH